MRNVVITAGGTSERIDSVRKITNSSSGKLGSLIANEVMKVAEVEQIYYLCDKKAALPKESEKLSIIYVTDVQSLDDQISTLLLNKKIDCVIHSMAVSDYTTSYVTNSEILSKNLENMQKNEIKQEILSKKASISAKNKISSYEDDLIIVLKPTQKVIQRIKQISPDITLVGFKLVANKSKEELVAIAENLMEKNKCDFVVANDLSNISEDRHEAIILERDGKQTTCDGKEDIAKKLCQKLFSKDNG